MGKNYKIFIYLIPIALVAIGVYFITQNIDKEDVQLMSEWYTYLTGIGSIAILLLFVDFMKTSASFGAIGGGGHGYGYRGYGNAGYGF